MAWIDPRYAEFQRKRWTRHDAHLWVRHDAHRFRRPNVAPEARFAPSPAYRGGVETEVDLATEAMRLRWTLHRLKRERAELLRERALKAGFNPDQPRVPAGSPGGGQWFGVGGQGAARVRLAQTDRLAGYPIDLRDEEARGGHTIEKHVNKSREVLIAQVRNAFLQDERAFDSRAGSFSSLEAATKLVNSTLSQNRAIVDQVASGVRSREVVISRFGSVTGLEAVMPTAHSQPFFRETYGVGAVIVHDRSSPRGYTVRTAFPTNR